MRPAGLLYSGQYPEPMSHWPAQQAIDNMPLQDLMDYKKLMKAVLQMQNPNPEAYWRLLREIEFGPTTTLGSLDSRSRTHA